MRERDDAGRAVIIVTEHARYRVEGEGPVWVTALEHDGTHPVEMNQPEWGMRQELPSLRLRVGLHMVWHADLPIRQVATDEEIDRLGFPSNRILAILPDEAAR